MNLNLIIVTICKGEKNVLQKLWINYKEIIIGLLITLILGLVWGFWEKDGAAKSRGLVLKQVESSKSIQDHYDAVVIGTDPEGVAAAVSSARNGMKTLLVDGRGRDILGGLMTLGGLNSLDLNYAPEMKQVGGRYEVLNKGIFQEWYKKMSGTSFDTTVAANEFYQMVKKESNIDLLIKTQSVKPLLQEKGERQLVQGIEVTKEDGSSQRITADAVIDATQDADFAAQTKAPFTFGREDMGDKNSRMAVTLVFKLGNVSEEAWKKLQQSAGKGFYDANSIWGMGKMWDYPTTDKNKVRMRGLNIGRQNDGTLLINSMQLFGVDPLNQESVAGAFETAKKELPHVLEYMKKLYPELKDATIADVAKELYVRESRHLVGEYRLSIVDLLDNRDQWDRIGFGSYRVDIQSTSYKHRGEEMFKPLQYAVPFRSIVPKNVDGLLVVGRSASFDSMAHGSARVIPTGMATGQAAGAAVKLAKEQGITFQEMSKSKEAISTLQARLTEQGMDLQPKTFELPPYATHKDYPGLKAAVGMNMAHATHDFDFQLDKPSNPARLANQLARIKSFHPELKGGDVQDLLKAFTDPKTAPLTADQAAYMLGTAVGTQVNQNGAADELVKQKLLKSETLQGISNKQQLTNGDVYMMIQNVVEAKTGVSYQ
ncbi:soluble pyridine nucleotide transhydrogenase [Paenibacillus larvae subsp. larvae]|uniref:Soluble pyridine nucleotide transhydrogenase n=2 Tax=Paenibacillus larvae TaxID=1464 RepID=A0A6C0QNB0_9BACL|nr:soluble pyridine nucleotide transhydrogenase [Paenibacillus larvae subsp. larvae]